MLKLGPRQDSADEVGFDSEKRMMTTSRSIVRWVLYTWRKLSYVIKDPPSRVSNDFEGWGRGSSVHWSTPIP